MMLRRGPWGQGLLLECSAIIKSLTWMLMPWLLAAPGHQQQLNQLWDKWFLIFHEEGFEPPVPSRYFNVSWKNPAHWGLTHWGPMTPYFVIDLGQHRFRWCLVSCKPPSYYLNQYQLVVKFKSKYYNFHSRKCIWKCHLHNVGHFVLVWVNPALWHQWEPWRKCEEWTKADSCGLT